MTGHDLERAQLAAVVRELLLCGHLIDRVTMPHVLGRWGREAMRDIAIDEWMGASPIYTRRTQRLLGFAGDDVETIFKGMQFDIGAPPQFMDFRYHVDDARNGEFHLDHCGALMDVEPMGSEYVYTMCHDIEDPTFDATAWATNPRARMRPIHRPPREPSDRQPHCAWKVTIEPDAEALDEPVMAKRLAASCAAQLPIATTRDGQGATDYAGPLVEDIDFTAFSASTLEALHEEIALQGHLLALASLCAIGARHGDAAAQEVGRRQLIGAAGVTAERLRRVLDLGSSATDVARLFAWHPLFRPSTYVHTKVTGDANELRLDFGPCPALRETIAPSWLSLLVADPDTAPLDVIVQAIDRHWCMMRIEPAPDAVASFVLVRNEKPIPRHPDVALADFSTGAAFVFDDKPIRVEITRARTG